MSFVVEDKIKRVLRFRIRIVTRKKKNDVVRELLSSPANGFVQSSSSTAPKPQVVSGTPRSSFSDWNARNGRPSTHDAQLNNEQLINKAEQLLKMIRSKYKKEVERMNDVKLSKRCSCNCTVCGRGSLSAVSVNSSPTSLNSDSRVQSLEQCSFISTISSSTDDLAVRDSLGRKLNSSYVNDSLPSWNIRGKDRIQYVESTGSPQGEIEDVFGSPLSV